AIFRGARKPGETPDFPPSPLEAVRFIRRAIAALWAELASRFALPRVAGPSARTRRSFASDEDAVGSVRKRKSLAI
ncbi:hypothetical protein, partial [Haematobacter missouriensis]|uniref:hypothetical protein n=1 Tax=Haematobacter missouriensis TaxID=366616 RepID=UPI001C52C13E